ncbi:hypothetical protein HOY82DRAFT_569173 [Tuber indicum]|nr:hypothetical protein HOY82DRAFT_569173 [Tuber indicum]
MNDTVFEFLFYFILFLFLFSLGSRIRVVHCFCILLYSWMFCMMDGVFIVFVFIFQG